MNIDVGAPEELVDLDQYPVLDPESSGFRAVVNKARVLWCAPGSR